MAHTAISGSNSSGYYVNDDDDGDDSDRDDGDSKKQPYLSDHKMSPFSYKLFPQ